MVVCRARGRDVPGHGLTCDGRGGSLWLFVVVCCCSLLFVLVCGCLWSCTGQGAEVCRERWLFVVVCD